MKRVIANSLFHRLMVVMRPHRIHTVKLLDVILEFHLLPSLILPRIGLLQWICAIGVLGDVWQLSSLVKILN